MKSKPRQVSVFLVEDETLIKMVGRSNYSYWSAVRLDLRGFARGTYRENDSYRDHERIAETPKFCREIGGLEVKVPPVLHYFSWTFPNHSTRRLYHAAQSKRSNHTHE